MIEVWEFLLEVLHHGKIKLGDVGIVGMLLGIVLVVFLCMVETCERSDLRDNPTGK
jgi:hypothetical protein